MEFLEANSPINIILAGDLNITLAPNEKKGGLRSKDFMHDTVEDFIQSLDLIDIKPKLGCFTWSNHIVGAANVSARLDQFLIHQSFAALGFRSDSKILPFNMSDHKPLLLDLMEEKKLGPTPFRFSPY